jgi:1-acyl-sn-glycerol-3-phosphate acyltransferase
MTNKKKKLDYSSRPNWFWYRVMRVFFFLVFHLIWPMKVRGRENVPRTGAAIIVCNHLSLADPFAVGYAANRLVCFMAKEELFRNPVMGFLIRQVGAFPVDRKKQDTSAMRTALTVLEEGKLLGMFPEGTRSTTGQMQEFRTGALRLAARTRNLVIPCALIHTDRAMPPGKLFRPARIGVSFGEPIEFKELYDRNDKGEPMERALATLREKIHALQERDSR